MSSKWALTVSFYLIGSVPASLSGPITRQLTGSLRRSCSESKNLPSLIILVIQLELVRDFKDIFCLGSRPEHDARQNKEFVSSWELRVSTVGLGPCGLPLIPLPLRGAQREVITLSPNRKPHQKEDHVSAQASEGEGSQAGRRPAPEHHWWQDAARAHTHTHAEICVTIHWWTQGDSVWGGG